ncbi:MAG: UDP-2,3-diacylglucosamine diphosphatase, partial [Flavobacteriales bacterium]
RGIPVHIHIGNHDMWAFDYLPMETGVTLHQDPIIREWNGKRLYIGHGDGLGPGDHGYKFMKGIFRNPVMQWCFARLHPNLGLGIAHFWSGRSRKKSYDNDRKWLGDDQEWLVQYCREMLKTEHYDFFIFGHRHLPVDLALSSRSASRDLEGTTVSRDLEGTTSRYLNLGDWITWFTYAVFDENGMRLMKRSNSDRMQDDRQITGGPAV